MKPYQRFNVRAFLENPDMAPEAAKVAKPAKATLSDRSEGQSLAALAALAAQGVPPASAPADIPNDWAEAIAKLHRMPCPARIAPGRWRAIVTAAGRFVSEGWAAKAAALQWDVLSLFGVHAEAPEARTDCLGLVPLLADREIVAMTENVATLRTRSGATQIFIRRPVADPATVPLWNLGEA